MLSHVKLALKAWFPLNVSVIATNRSCLLARTLLRFAGFHRHLSVGTLRGLLYLEACKSRSASGISSEISTFRKSSLFFLFLALLFFFGGQNIFFPCVVGFYRSQSQHIAAQASQALASPRKSSTCAALLRGRRLLLRTKATKACDRL